MFARFFKKKHKMKQEFTIPTMASLFAKGERPEVLFWIGCAGSFDQRAKKITKAFAELLHKAGVKFAVLGSQESCTGDPAKRSGNEFLFQMQAMMNIEVLNQYQITKIVTTCPHCFNTLKNEYPQLGGTYQVLHHTQLLQELLNQGRLKVEGGFFKGKRITFHDPCYLGRANNEYEAPRKLLQTIEAQIIEIKQCRSKGTCCGAGGGQMFKEAEKGSKEINILRSEQALKTRPDIIATGCPFCNTMLTDGLKTLQSHTPVEDIAELLNKNC